MLYLFELILLPALHRVCAIITLLPAPCLHSPADMINLMSSFSLNKGFKWPERPPDG